MFHSIRWRLVASFVGVTLLTVALIGVLSLSLIRQQIARQQADYLRTNADSIATQAEPLFLPRPNQFALQQLARTSAFLSNSHVRILDAGQTAVADSGQSATATAEYLWLQPLLELYPDLDASLFGGDPAAMVVPLEKDGTFSAGLLDEQQFSLSDLPAGTEYTVIRQEDTPWGARLVFDQRQVDETFAASDADASDTTPSSEQSVTQPIIVNDNIVGYVELSGSAAYSQRAVETARRALLLAGLGAALLAGLAALLVSRTLSAPLTGLAATATQMGAGDLSVRALVRGKDEIGQLGQQFNLMAGRLEASFAELAAERDSLRRFIADASHELRTPITALKNFNELLQGAAAQDPTAASEFLQESGAQIARLEWITANLLNLSRLDGGLVQLDWQEEDAGDLIEAAAAPFKVRAQEQGVRLIVTPPTPQIVCRCDPPRLEMALANLLDNAFKATPAGGEVRIAAQAVHDKVLFTVEDTGKGIAAADLPHVFERFYRGQNSDTSGTGLGLAIVQSVLQAHGGAAQVASTLGAGSRFTLELPLPAASEL